MDRFLALIGALAAEGPVVVLGGPNDLDATQRAAVDAIGGVENLVGRLSFGQTLGAISAASLYIGHDTGATHGAALLGKPYVALYSGFDNQRFMPALLYDGQGIVLQNRPACSREHGCARRICPDNICMTSITVDAVLKAAKSLDAAAHIRSTSPVARGTSSLSEAQARLFSTTQCRDI
jgi:ADP-heptose:LPS heptosyltransferase